MEHLVLHQNKRNNMYQKCFTYGICFAEVACHHIVHIVVLTQFQFQEVNLYFTMLHKHSMFNYLRMEYTTGLEKTKPTDHGNKNKD